MLVIYDDITKKVTAVSISTATVPTCELLCSHHEEGHNCDECHWCFQSTDDKEVLENMDFYRVDDSGFPMRTLIKLPQYLMLFECDKELILSDPYPLYYMPVTDELANITIKFKDEEENPITPTGNLSLDTSRGNLSSTEIILDGTISEKTVNWTPVPETITIKFKANFSGENQELFKQPVRMKIKLTS